MFSLPVKVYVSTSLQQIHLRYVILQSPAKEKSYFDQILVSVWADQHFRCVVLMLLELILCLDFQLEK